MTKMANPRKLAVKTLVKIEKEGTFSNLAVKEALSESGFEQRDKAFATALIYGVLDRKITLDYILSKFLKTPINKTPEFTVSVLRTALYQIRFMDKIPQSAAVNEAVKLIKASKESRNSGFVNGVLRNILRTPIDLPKGDSAEDLSIRYSVPIFIVKSFLKDYELENTKALLEESLKPAPVVLRINTVKTTVEAVKESLEKQNISFKEIWENSLCLLEGIDISKNELYKKGFVYAQDTASQRAVSVLAPKAGDRVLDMCAAPGGKTFTMANLMDNSGEIVACDIYTHRVELIKKSAERLGLDIVKPKVADATEFNADLGEFDCILCDVPCSGWGVIRRKPEIKYQGETDFTNLQNTQYKILCNAVKYLKKGGKLLYSTCTLRCEENEKLVFSFQKEYNDIYKVYEHTFMPHKDGTDGFYCALLEKR